MIGHNNVVKLVTYIIFLQYYCLCTSFFSPQFFAHPVMYNLMKKKWFGSFGKMKKYSWLELGWWKWIVLNIWCLFDIVLFPFLFTTFSIKDYITKATRRRKGEKKLSKAFVFEAFVCGHPLLTGACIAHIKRQKLM